MFNIYEKILLHFVLVSILFYNVNTQVGKKCSLPKTENPGICKKLLECPSAFEDKKNFGIDPNICFYHFNEAIVCCKDDVRNKFQNSQDHFVFPDDASFSVSRPRKSELKCDEYSKLLVQVVQAIPLVTNPDPIITEVPKCDYNSIPLIVGGSPAEPGEYPHMALLGYNINNKIDWSCGGTLISDRYVLTAAHCLYTRIGQPVVVRLGELNLATNDDNSSPEDFNIEDIQKHPDYKLPQKYNDIGLIRLSRTVRFNNFIRPACLWTKYNINQSKTIATGWGHTEFAGRQSDALLKVALDIIDNKQCNSYYQEAGRYLPMGIQSSMLCAGSLQGGKDTCQGDSGGPLQITSPNNQCLFYIVGITSFGKGCGAVNSSAVYTRVSEYVPWIESVVWPN